MGSTGRPPVPLTTGTACSLVGSGTDAFAIAAVVGVAGQVACSSFPEPPAVDATGRSRCRSTSPPSSCSTALSPITSLRIDRSFITRIEHDDRDRHLVEAVLGLARALGLAVVAEGVETAGQRRLLEDLGCESAQGYLFGRPCATTAFTAFLEDPVGAVR